MPFIKASGGGRGITSVGVNVEVVGWLNVVVSEGCVGFVVVRDEEVSGVVYARGAGTGVSVTVGCAASLIGGDVTGAPGLQPTSIVNTRNAAKTPRFIILISYSYDEK
jgi:hypothetical protein